MDRRTNTPPPAIYSLGIISFGLPQVQGCYVNPATFFAIPLTPEFRLS